MLIHKPSQNGFTLVEMMVSVALFSVVLTVTLGTILTIADSNKKARSLMSVTNNLNFAIDSMVRSLKAGTDMKTEIIAGNSCITTQEIKYVGLDITSSNQFPRQKVQYCFSKPSGSNGSITKNVENAGAVPLTSPDVDIEYVHFDMKATAQPYVIIRIEGTVKISEQISSKFNIQTSVSQRQLQIPTTILIP